MNRKALFILIYGLLSLITITSCSIYHRQKGSPVTKYSPQVILKWHEVKFRWMAEKNTDSLSVLLDDDVQYIHSNGWTETKSEVLNNITSGYLTYHSVDIRKATIRQYEKCFIVTGEGLFRVSLKDKPIDIELLYTEIYTVSGHEIKLVHRHACKKPETR